MKGFENIMVGTNPLADGPINNSKQEKEARVAEMLKEGIQELVIHGETKVSSEGLEYLALRPDLDSRCAVYLLELAGIDYNQLSFVPKGEWITGSVNIDTGERPAFDIEADGTVFFDHHGPFKVESGQATSATKIIYGILVRQGLLRQAEWLDTLVNFVTEIDNADYPLNRGYFENDWWRSLYGLQKAISFESLVNLIRDGKDPRKPFSRELAESATITRADKEEATLFSVCLNQQKLVDNSIAGATKCRREMDSQKIKVSVPGLFDSVLVNVLSASTTGEKNKMRRNSIPLGYTAVRALGFNSYVLWDEGTGGFFITGQDHLEDIYEKILPQYPQAKIIRGTMILYPGLEQANLKGQKFSPNEFLKCLGLKD